MWEGDINYKWKCSKWGRSSLPFPIYYLLSSSQYPFSASYLSLYLGFGFFENLSTGQMRVKQVPLCNDFLRFYCCPHSSYLSLILEHLSLAWSIGFLGVEETEESIFSKLTGGVPRSVLEDGSLSSCSDEVAESSSFYFSFGFLHIRSVSERNIRFLPNT